MLWSNFILGLNLIFIVSGCDNAGLEINFFTQEPAGDLGEKFGRQIINFGRQLI